MTSPKQQQDGQQNTRLGSTAAQPQPGKGKWRRWRWPVYGVLALVLMLAITVGAVWRWAATEGSLQTAVNWAQRFMPAGSSLQADSVKGSVRGGGSIGRLVYRQSGKTADGKAAENPSDKSLNDDGALTVTLDGIDAPWHLPPFWTMLRQPAWMTDKLHVQKITVADTRQSLPQAADEAAEPLKELRLPLSVSLPFVVDEIHIIGGKDSTGTRLHKLQGSYTYGLQQAQHNLHINSLRHDYGRLQLNASLQGAAPMQLQLQSLVHVTWSHAEESTEKNTEQSTEKSGTTDPKNAAQNLQNQQSTHIQLLANGTLSGIDAGLHIQAQARQPNDAKSSAKAKDAAKNEADSTPALLLQATVQPWQALPVSQADVRMHKLNLQAFLPQAPLTALNGSVQLHMEPQQSVLQGQHKQQAEHANEHTGESSHPALKAMHQWLANLTGKQLQGSVRIENTAAGAWDKSRLPLHALQANVSATAQNMMLQDLRWQPSEKGGAITGQAHYHTAAADGNDAPVFAKLQLDQLELAAVYSTLQAERVQGSVSVQSAHPSSANPAAAKTDTSSGIALAFLADLQSIAGKQRKAAPLHFDELYVQGSWQAPEEAPNGKTAKEKAPAPEQHITLETIRIRSRQAGLQGQARYALVQQAAQADLKLQLPGSSAWVNGSLSPQDGKGQAGADAQNLQQTGKWLQQWLPKPYAQYVQHLQGTAQWKADWQGGWQNLVHNGEPVSEQANKTAALQLQSTLTVPSAGVQPAGRAEAFKLQNTRLAVQGALDDLRLQAQIHVQHGKRQIKTTLHMQGGQKQNTQQGKKTQGWHAQVQTLQADWQDGSNTLQTVLAAPLSVDMEQSPKKSSKTPAARTDAAELHVQISALQLNMHGNINKHSEQTQVHAEPTTLHMQKGSYTLSTKGRIQGLPVAWAGLLMEQSADPLLAGDMRLNGHWNVEMGQTLRVQAALQRSSGDLSISTGMAADNVLTNTPSASRIAAGVQAAGIELRNNGNNVELDVLWQTAHAGTAQAQLRTQLAQNSEGWSLPPAAPVQGHIKARLPRIGVWNVFAPPGWRLRGSMQADIAVNGTIQAPLLQGTLNGDDLSVRSVTEGVALGKGRLRVRLNGHRMDIDEFSLQGTEARTGFLGGSRIGGGAVRMSGYAQWSGNARQPFMQSMQVQLNTVFEQLQFFSTSDRMLVLSGNINTGLNNMRIDVQGGLKVNRALIDLPEDSAPALDDDVTVVAGNARTLAALNNADANSATATPTSPADNPPTRQQQTQASPQANPNLHVNAQVSVDLGDNFRLRGYGLDTRLNGTLSLVGGPSVSSAPKLTGTVNTADGTFRAYGQDLQLESGKIVFFGAAGNPALDISAVRNNIDRRVGMRITGTAQRPSIQLFSDAPMPDSERLSWIVLGRSSGNATDSALMQQAALALLSGSGRGITGRLADTLGLDEVGFKGGESISESSVTMGKRFSKRFYATYEKGLDATLGTLYFFMDINRKLKLRAQTGQESELKLIYTHSYD